MNAGGLPAFLSLKNSSPFQIISFRWPIAKEVPSAIRRLTISEFMNGLDLAAHTVEAMKDQASKVEFEEVLKKETERIHARCDAVVLNAQKRSEELEAAAAETLKTTQEKYERTVKGLEGKLSELEASLAAAKSGNSILRDQMETMRQSVAAVYEDSMKRAMEQKEAAVKAELERLQQYHRDTIASMERQARDIVSRMEEKYKAEEEKLRAEYAKQTSASSAVRGAVGETAFDDLVLEHTTWGELVNTSKIPHATDRCGVVRGCQTLFELKNYSVDVPSEQLRKFYRDMEENTDKQLGVFISLKTGIQTLKKKGFMTVEWTKDGQLIVFIQNFYEHDAAYVLGCIELFASIALDVYTFRQQHKEDTGSVLQKRIDQAKPYIEKELKGMGDLLRRLTVNKKHLVDMAERQFNDAKATLESSKAALKTTLDILLLGNVEQVDEMAADVVTAPVAAPAESEVAVVDMGVTTTGAKKRGGAKKKV
jgi:hypothetical protein